MAQELAGQKDGGRIVFLDYLRAAAVLLVVWAHLFIVGPNNPESMRPWLPSVTDNAFGAQTVFTNPHGQLDLFFLLNFGISSGPLGVALFFMISGFVILRSIDRLSPGAFLVQRAFRIFPPCAVAVAGVALFTALYCAAAGVASPHGPSSVLASAFAFSGFAGVMGTLPVLWSLTVELLFYLLIAAAAALVGRIGFRTLLAMAALCVFCVWLFNTPAVLALVPAPTGYRLVYLSSMLVHVTFMLVGSVLYRGFSDNRHDTAALCAALVFGLYLASFMVFKELRGQAEIGAKPADAVAALGLFLAAYAGRLSWGWLRPLRFVADISYPLYLLHVPLGWVLLVWLGRMGWNLHWAATAATAAMLVLAWAMHLAVERPSQRLGKWLSRHGTRPAPSRPASGAMADAATAPVP
jgi:peptidoglycan/LPS O-acetylase OafA/YrhL